MKNILFSERQRFRQWWIWLIFISLNGLFLFGVIKQVVFGQQFGDKPMSDTGLMIFAFVFFVFSLLFLNLRLDTILTKEGIFVRFFPVHFAYRKFSWNNLKKCYVRTYKAIPDYGGWGLRSDLFGKGKAYNVSGNKGIQLVLKDDSKILIGTLKPDEVTEVLKQIGQLQE